MSHTSTIKKVLISDADAIANAVQNLKSLGVNCNLKKNAVPRMFYKDQHKSCDFVLELADSRYDLGFQKNGANYEIVCDLWGGDINKQLGVEGGSTPEHAIGKFSQQYAVEAAKNNAINQGYSVDNCIVDDHGNIQLTISNYNL
jgi:Protein of unknown function (DUF1257)